MKEVIALQTAENILSKYHCRSGTYEPLHHILNKHTIISVLLTHSVIQPAGLFTLVLDADQIHRYTGQHDQTTDPTFFWCSKNCGNHQKCRHEEEGDW